MILSDELIHWLEQEYAKTLNDTFATLNDKNYFVNVGKVAMIDQILKLNGKHLAVGIKATETPPEKK